jgi:hypothetical protein
MLTSGMRGFTIATNFISSSLSLMHRTLRFPLLAFWFSPPHPFRDSHICEAWSRRIIGNFSNRARFARVIGCGLRSSI